MKKSIIKYLFSICIFSLHSTLTFASTWNFVWVGNENVRFFFDADSIEKTKDQIMIWMKTVQVKNPDTDGSWSTAARWKINCTRKTIQTIAMSTYTKQGNFIKSYSGVTDEQVVTPDSTGDGMLKIACKSNFPNDTSEKEYFKLLDNDVFKATRNYGEFTSSQSDLAPK